MSFFLQTQRKTNWQKFGAPSPCQYEQSKLDNSRKFACAPFGSTTKIGRMEKLKNNNPQKLDRLLDEQFAVNDMNIKIRAQEHISSMFKSETKRFNNQIEEQPGPGEYSIPDNRLSKTFSLTQFSKNMPILTKQTVPSMPVDNLGFKEDQNNEMKKVKPKQRSQPDPASYNVKTNVTTKGVVSWKPEKPLKKENETIPGPGNYELNSSLSQKVAYSCFNSQTDRFGYTKKIAPTKTPGPGQYYCQTTSKGSYNKCNQSYFNSKTSRFQKQPKGLDTAPGMYFNDKMKSKSMNHFNKFINRQQQNNMKGSNKVSIFQVKNKNPGPGQYKNNAGISYTLHRALLKKQVTDVLPKQKRQVFQVKQSQMNPGPGQYDSKIIKKQNSKGKLYKKVEVVKLKNQQQPHPSPAQYENFHNTIESKIKQINSKLTLTEDKPFNIGSQRFKHYSSHIIMQNKGDTLKTQNTDEIQQQTGVGMLQGTSNKKVKRLVMTTIKVRVPFGISTNKFQEKFIPYQGPDFYNKPLGWIKPSFNIKGKIQ